MSPSGPKEQDAKSFELEKLEMRIASRSDALSRHTMPADWEVIKVRIPRPKWYRLLFFKILARLKRRRIARSFQNFGSGSSIDKPYWVRGGPSISIGDRVTIWQSARLTAVNYSPERTIISIGEGSAIHSNVHISAAMRVSIGKDVLFAANCYVTDHDHDWLDPHDPPRTNGRLLAKPTSIGDRTWLGERVTVLKGVEIGEGCVIGANSVVTSDIPPYSVAVGSPARVVRRWDHELGAWMKVEG